MAGETAKIGNGSRREIRWGLYIAGVVAAMFMGALVFLDRTYAGLERVNALERRQDRQERQLERMEGKIDDIHAAVLKAAPK